MANPFGEKNIGPWEGQQVEYIPLDDLVLWTENPRDPLDAITRTTMSSVAQPTDATTSNGSCPSCRKRWATDSI